jgi:hypothetical protein
MTMPITFSGGTLIAGIVALTMTVISAGPANSEPKDDPIPWIIQYENDAAAADLAGDVSFYQKNLTDDWSDGMSNGQFQTKKQLISDLTDKVHNITFHETLANMKVRVYGDTAVAKLYGNIRRTRYITCLLSVVYNGGGGGSRTRVRKCYWSRELHA